MGKINDGHYLELTDRIYIFISNLEEHVLNHPLTKKEKKVKKLITEAGINLAQAYQIIGGKMFEIYEKNEKNEKNECPIVQVISRRHKKSKK